ncbi:MAG TPA: DUF488 domain-containing protein [Pirellulaceae bacterium]
MPTLWTIGHSNRPLADFLSLLTENKIESLADVRLLPGSRRHPQFDQDALATSLADANVTYTHFRALGGRRTKRAGSSPNSAWQVAAFAAYADYMLTPEFRAAFAELRELAETRRTAIMCAESLPWRCHRRLIADQFLATGWQVRDIIGPHNTKSHNLPSFAKIQNNQVTYPGGPTLFD